MTIRFQALVDIGLFMEIRRIEDALRNHSCTEALAWCNENKAALRKGKVRIGSEAVAIRPLILAIQCTLEFDLRLQEYIELNRAGKTLDAIAYSRKHLAPWQETHFDQVQRASALLAYPP